MALRILEDGGTQGQALLDNVTAVVGESWQRLVVRTNTVETDRTKLQVEVGTRSAHGPQAGDVLYVDDLTLRQTENTAEHWVAFKRDNGETHGPVIATRIPDSDRSIILAGPLPWTPNSDGDRRERTAVLFGRADKWARYCRVIATIPRGGRNVDLLLVKDDDRVHLADQATYVPPSDTEVLGSIPDAPVVEQDSVSVNLVGRTDNRQLRVRWAPAQGAQEYVVEYATTWQAVGREIRLQASVVFDGPFLDGEIVRACDADAVQLSELLPFEVFSGQAKLRIHEPGHGLTSGDWVCLEDFPAVANIPAAEFDGFHSVTVVDADHFEIATTTVSNDSLTWVRGAAVWARSTGATGVIDGDQGFPTARLRYFKQGGEFGVRDRLHGDTSGATALAGGDAIRGKGWVRLGTTSDVVMRQTILLEQEGDDVADPATIVVRVRAVGRLMGPWAYGSVEDSEAVEALVAVDLRSNQVMDAGQPLGLSHDAAVRIDKDTISASVTLPARAAVVAVHIVPEEAFNGTGNTVDVGHSGDPNAFASAVDVSNTTPKTIDRNTTPGVEIGKPNPSPVTVDVALTATGATQGSCIVVIDYRVYPEAA